MKVTQDDWEAARSLYEEIILYETVICNEFLSDDECFVGEEGQKLRLDESVGSNPQELELIIPDDVSVEEFLQDAQEYLDALSEEALSLANTNDSLVKSPETHNPVQNSIPVLKEQIPVSYGTPIGGDFDPTLSTSFNAAHDGNAFIPNQTDLGSVREYEDSIRDNPNFQQLGKVYTDPGTPFNM